MEKKPINVAIAGLGVIGSGVAAVIRAHESEGAPIRLVKILEVNTDGPYAKPFYAQFPGLFTTDLKEILNDPEIDVIVETIGGRGFSKTLIEEALNHGKHVVSANKDLIATHGEFLLEMARNSEKHFLFEASVGGAIPVIRLMENYFSLSDVEEVSGILNGTTNYILSEMDEKSVEFEEVLKEAQAKGFAEQDPTNDVKGYDARYKILILIYLITGKWVPIDEIGVEGIDNLELSDFEYAERMNCKIKLIAYFSRQKNFMDAFVMPLMVPRDHILSKVGGATNIVTVKGKYSDEISLIGQGAGSHPTASAIVSDIYKIRETDYSFNPPWQDHPFTLRPFSEYIFKHTLRIDINDQPGIVGDIGSILAKYHINIYALEQLPQYHHREGNLEKTVFHLTLEACQEGIVRKAVEEINNAEYMARPVFVLRELYH
ncbi:MAG: homoserine dehydrogenase [SAR324 cluster bacterium]|nr:homoserine dehydrogenase [SAR324 cluster bacterium]